MAARPVQVSLDTVLIDRIDADPETRKRGRSAFVRSAVERYLAAKARRAVDAKIAAAYQGRADAVLAEADDVIDTQSWPDE